MEKKQKGKQGYFDLMWHRKTEMTDIAILVMGWLSAHVVCGCTSRDMYCHQETHHGMAQYNPPIS